MIKRIVMSLAAVTFLAAAPAFAQTEAPVAKEQETAKVKALAQTRHCFMDDKLVADKTQKQCIAAGGKWQRDAGAAAKTESMKVDPMKAEPTKAESMKVESMKVDPMKVEPTKAESMKAEPSTGRSTEPATKQ